ncbi:MAG TPA: thiol reductant ABC exporter subunit CydC [Gammaproteobacteria bacterium]|nr:thiol reductant ABC exporter subunit CydC [Gammaproteobacteria bacterium]
MRDLLRLVRLFRGAWRWMALGAFVALVVVLANMALLGTAGWFIAAMAAAGAAGTTMNYFTPAAAIRAFAILRTGGRYVERLVTHEATLRFLSRLRVWFYERLEPLAPAALERYRSGDLLSRIRADIDALDNLYLRTLIPLFVAVLGTAAAVSFLARFSTWLAAADLLCLLLAGLAVPMLVQRLGARPGARMVETSSQLRVAVIDGVQGLAELTVFGAAREQRERVERFSAELVREQERMSRISGLGTSAWNAAQMLAIWLAAIIGITLVRGGGVAGVDLPLLVLLVMASFEAVSGLPQAWQYLGQTLTSARRILEIVDTEPPVRDPDRPLPAPQAGDIRIRRLRFRYDADGPWVLDGLSLELGPGRHVAIVGPSGSGKSSLLGLLLRFRDYQGGSIRLGGEELSRYRAADVRECIATVAQHPHLFNTTVRENLLLADPEADEQRLREVAATAQIAAEIDGLPQGYDTWVGEAGLRLSGGQARRLALARALLRDAPVLALDEPTEGLDTELARSLLAAVREHAADRALLLITHRLAGLEQMDEIMVLERGRVIERGTHTQLMARGGRYREMHAVLGTAVE